MKNAILMSLAMESVEESDKVDNSGVSVNFAEDSSQHKDKPEEVDLGGEIDGVDVDMEIAEVVLDEAGEANKLLKVINTITDNTQADLKAIDAKEKSNEVEAKKDLKTTGLAPDADTELVDDKGIKAPEPINMATNAVPVDAPAVKETNKPETPKAEPVITASSSGNGVVSKNGEIIIRISIENQMARLGKLINYKLPDRLARESNNDVNYLKHASESLKDMAKQAVEKVKAFIKKIIEWCKAFYVTLKAKWKDTTSRQAAQVKDLNEMKEQGLDNKDSRSIAYSPPGRNPSDSKDKEKVDSLYTQMHKDDQEANANELRVANKLTYKGKFIPSLIPGHIKELITLSKNYDSATAKTADSLGKTISDFFKHITSKPDELYDMRKFNVDIRDLVSMFGHSEVIDGQRVKTGPELIGNKVLTINTTVGNGQANMSELRSLTTNFVTYDEHLNFKGPVPYLDVAACIRLVEECMSLQETRMRDLGASAEHFSKMADTYLETLEEVCEIREMSEHYTNINGILKSVTNMIDVVTTKIDMHTTSTNIAVSDYVDICKKYFKKY